ncbi:MAG: precorrin-4 C(11)-methyltransferase [Spirochaetes bacterium]|nr:MAG: precorrin-4 C(11)-methyltransferase [Spirochaetota bacterium]
MKVVFIGAGPGDPDLITVKGSKIIRTADIIIYAGSLVNPQLLEGKRKETPVYNSAEMNLDQIKAIYLDNRERPGIIARLHSGDPSLFGAIQEQIDLCIEENIGYEIIPGVSSFSAGAAVLKQELTLPGVSQTVILTRISGRTKTPQSESLEKLAQHRCTMVIFLSAAYIEDVVRKLGIFYPKDTPVAVVYRAGWPEEKILKSSLDKIAELVKQHKIKRQALIYVGRVLSSDYELSKLYSWEFTHGFRKGRDK